ncbi:endoribonuclease YBEY, chloroplastic isoform X1 [Coffea arabica]|uniref:Endoribonuclease YBEY, chloroplastic isoform X1 n=2 Tax=Coffea arabica TaxID=13443 RepID=A0A6P6U1Z0_COFAR|nr:endoribonuclease YBEY, chloroplastic-like [Coffea arabica]
MLSRLSPFLRIVPPAHSQIAAEPMAAARALTFRLIPSLANSPHAPLSPSQSASSSRYPISLPLAPPLRYSSTSLYWQQSSIFGPAAALSCKDDRRLFWSVSRGFGRVFASWREYRKARRKPAPPTARAKAKSKEKELELSVNICIEEQLPDDPEILDIAELLRVNVPMAMKLGLEGLKDSVYKTRDNSITDVGGFESVELSVLLCNDEFICKLNKEWRGEDHATDVLSMSQHVPELKLPVLMLGDIVISVETAARQAEERGHTLLDEIRILLVHGLLHLLGFDHEISDKAEAEMEKEEEHLLKSLGWKGKGLIQSAYDAETNGSPPLNYPDDRKREGSLRFYRPKFNFIFCDMDGTLLNSESQVSTSNATALKVAISRGVKIVIATGKTRPAVIRLLKKVDLAGKGGAISEFSPGIFLQGLLVYGRQGREIFRSNLDPNVCREASMYSLKHQTPLIAFSEDRCLTLFEHPLVDSLHTVYSEPKAEIIPTVDQLLAGGDIQKLIFLDSAEGVATTLRPYWAEATGDYASVVQAVPDMLEIVPSGTSKGRGVRLLLDHLGASPTEVMAIGDGENDVEMLELASLGVALSNGSEKAKAVADVVGLSNDEDGAADAIYRYAF